MRWNKITSIFALMILPASVSVRAFSQQSEMPNYVYELWYHVYTNRNQAFNAYFVKLREADLKTKSGGRRWGDTHPWSNMRVVAMPAAELAEYDKLLDSETVFRNAFGEEEYLKYAGEYVKSQISRASYLRKYRNDLSLNREKHKREGIKATAYSLVAVMPTKIPQFEQMWLKVLTAYKQVAPAMIITAAETLAGGGPQYVFARPLKNYAEYETDLTPEQAVESAYGRAEAEAFNRMVSASVKRWETFIFDKGNFDVGIK